jgi:hypothetical protein
MDNKNLKNKTINDILLMSKEEIAEYIATMTIDDIAKICNTRKHILEAVSKDKLAEVILQSIKYTNKYAIYYMIQNSFGSSRYIACEMGELAEALTDVLNQTDICDIAKHIKFKVEGYCESDGCDDFCISNLQILDNNLNVIELSDETSSMINDVISEQEPERYEMLQRLNDETLLVEIA